MVLRARDESVGARCVRLGVDVRVRDDVLAAPGDAVQRSGRFDARGRCARARCLHAHAGHVAFAASARGAFECARAASTLSRALTAPRVSSTARPTPSASTSTPGTRDSAPRPKPPAGGAARTTTLPPRFADPPRTPWAWNPPPSSTSARGPPPRRTTSTNSTNSTRTRWPSSSSTTRRDPTRPPAEERRDEHPRGRHLRERDDAAMDEGAGRRASPTTGTRSKSVVGRRSSALANAVVRTTGRSRRRVSHARASRPSHASPPPRAPRRLQRRRRARRPRAHSTRIWHALRCGARIRERDANEPRRPRR